MSIWNENNCTSRKDHWHDKTWCSAIENSAAKKKVYEGETTKMVDYLEVSPIVVTKDAACMAALLLPCLVNKVICD